MSAKPHVLIVDDTADYLRSLAIALRSRYDVKMAQTVNDAKALCADQLSVVLVDVCLDETSLTDRSGLELLRWIRTMFPSLPLVAMSAVPDETLPEQAISAGATQFLRKPISVMKLLEVLASLMKGRSDGTATNPDS